MIILDTCALLWLVNGGDRISQDTLKLIAEEPVVSVAAISAFEIGLKYRQGKLKLPMPPADWWTRVVDHHRLNVMALTADICIKATELPNVHKDAADRFIIASSLLSSAPVVTADNRFSQYGVNVLL